MNIIHKLIHKRFISFFIASGSALLFINHAIKPARFTIHCDQRCDEKVARDIKKLVKNHALLSSKQLLTELQKEYAFVQEVEKRTYSSKNADIWIRIAHPRVRILSTIPGNNEFFLCAHGMLYEKKFFKGDYFEDLPSFVVEGGPFEELIASDELRTCALELSLDVYDKYAITWRSKSDILLQSLQSKSILIADVHSIHDKEKRNYVSTIAAAEPEKYTNGIKADIRLSDSLVCSPL